MGEPEGDPVGAPDVAGAVHVLAVDHLGSHHGPEPLEPGQGVVDVVAGEPDPEVAEGSHRGGAVAQTGVGVRHREGSIRLVPSGARSIATSTRWPCTPATLPDHSPSSDPTTPPMLSRRVTAVPGYYTVRPPSALVNSAQQLWVTALPPAIRCHRSAVASEGSQLAVERVEA